MKLSFVWWNTSLSPVSKPNCSSPEKRAVASKVIQWLAETLEVDVICLGEVSQEDIILMQSLSEAFGYTVRSGVEKIGRTSFDTCVLYKSSKLLFLDGENLTSVKGTSFLKVAQRLDFGVSDNETVIHLFVSHWPSRLWCHENHSDRSLLGIRLRDNIEEVGLVNRSAHVVVLGDFNDEPFSSSLSEQLMATRDRSLAAKGAHLLYNPFWRHLGASKAYQVGDINLDHSGSYHYKSDNKCRWRTFDQIIFSSSFLGRTKWHLREDMVNVIDIPGYTDLVHGTEMKFDHLPVIGVIEKEI
ncbi:MAG: endonuclease/exonuclease/phosphatase family protein [Burkholderiaceae bacterium]|nr:endonuclease/exonuclease/phosphatase family protein [Burkholderiaceae bacterium]